MRSKLIIVLLSIAVFYFSGFTSNVGAYSKTKKSSEETLNTDLSVKKGNNAVRDFDFLVGEWNVRHRRIDAKSQKWVEFDGTCSNRNLTDGWVNFEEHKLNAPNGAYKAVALRSFDAKNRQWTIRWLDSRYPQGSIDPGVKGGFENGIGTFYADFKDSNGKPMRVRFIWSEITANSARWEQSVSADAGETWETNWIMNFQRMPQINNFGN